MNPVTEPVAAQSAGRAAPHTAQDWLDALAKGACDQDAFFEAVGKLLVQGADVGWELLALVDQYYRRGRIDAETFGTVKTQLQSQLLGTEQGQEVSVPLPVTRGLGAALGADPAGSREITAEVQLPSPPAGMRSAAPSAPAPSAPAPSAPAPSAPASSAPASSAPASSAAIAGAAAWPRVPTRDAPQAVAAPPERSLVPGELLRGRYRIQRLLGQGGMGMVFEAIDQFRLDRTAAEQRVALKVLHTAVIRRPELFAELRREFQHLQALSHPNIVRVHEFDRDGDTAFFTMEYLSGALLSQVLSTRQFSALYRPYALAIIRNVGAAVAYAHARGVVHGDLNPGNIFITDDGEVRVLDFGASDQLRRDPWISEYEHPPRIAVATSSYASCQLLEGWAADARDDVYAMACISYVLLAGSHPFRGQTALQARTARLTLKRPAGLTQKQWSALQAGLHFERKHRPPDLQAWLDRFDLRAAATHLPPLPSLVVARPQRRRGGAGWLAAAIVLLAAGAWAATHLDGMRHGAAGFGAAAVRLWSELRPGATDADIAGNAAVVTAPATAAPSSRVMTGPSAQLQPPAAATPSAVRGDSTKQDLTKQGQAGPSAATQGAAAAVSPAVTASAAAGVTPLRPRIQLETSSLDIAPSQAVASILVRRSRTLRGGISFSWWTESGTAKPGRDFVNVKPHVEYLEAGEREVALLVPIVVDPQRHVTRSFYVFIDNPSDNATLGARTVTMVTIAPTD